jgi:hypothetical protein
MRIKDRVQQNRSICSLRLICRLVLRQHLLLLLLLLLLFKMKLESIERTNLCAAVNCDQ